MNTCPAGASEPRIASRAASYSGMCSSTSWRRTRSNAKRSLVEAKQVGHLEPEALVSDERRGRDHFLAQFQADRPSDETRLSQRVDHPAVVCPEVAHLLPLEPHVLLQPGNHDVSADDPLILEVGEAGEQMPARRRLASGRHRLDDTARSPRTLD